MRNFRTVRVFYIYNVLVVLRRSRFTLPASPHFLS